MKTELYSFSDKTRSFTITATLKENEIEVLDHSLDPALEKIRGRPEDESYITVKGENFQKLFLILFKEKFSGNNTLSELRKWLEENNLKYDKFTY